MLLLQREWGGCICLCFATVGTCFNKPQFEKRWSQLHTESTCVFYQNFLGLKAAGWMRKAQSWNFMWIILNGWITRPGCALTGSCLSPEAWETIRGRAGRHPTGWTWSSLGRSCCRRLWMSNLQAGEILAECQDLIFGVSSRPKETHSLSDLVIVLLSFKIGPTIDAGLVSYSSYSTLVQPHTASIS